MDALAFVLGCTTIAFFFHRYAPEAYMVRSSSETNFNQPCRVSRIFTADLQRLAQCQPLTLVIAFEMQTSSTLPDFLSLLYSWEAC